MKVGPGKGPGVATEKGCGGCTTGGRTLASETLDCAGTTGTGGEGFGCAGATGTDKEGADARGSVPGANSAGLSRAHWPRAAASEEWPVAQLVPPALLESSSKITGTARTEAQGPAINFLGSVKAPKPVLRSRCQSESAGQQTPISQDLEHALLVRSAIGATSDGEEELVPVIHLNRWRTWEWALPEGDGL